MEGPARGNSNAYKIHRTKRIDKTPETPGTPEHWKQLVLHVDLEYINFLGLTNMQTLPPTSLTKPLEMIIN